MKLLFLDFDGVLHPNFSKPTEYFSRVDALMEVVDTRITELNVIISSSWRFHHSYEELLAKLPESLRLIVKGVTPQVGPGQYQRHREIHAYLRRNRSTPDWRALDDDLREFPKGCRELIACDGRVGVAEESANQLRDWLDVGD